jgi:hypothetical protein
MTWASIILALLKLANFFWEFGQQQRWIAQGRDEEIARATAEILRKTNYAKQALDEFAGKSDADIDDFLRSLEPGKPDGK